MQRRVHSEEGSVLLSTFHLLVFISFLIISLTSIVRLQVMQLQQISDSYEAKAMIQMSEAHVRQRIELGDIETGRILFSEGMVEVEKETETKYTLVATLLNQYTSRSTIEIPLPEDEEIPDEEVVDEERVTEKSLNELNVTGDPQHSGEAQAP